MYSVTKWMLVAVLIGANGGVIARAEAYNLDNVTGDTGCRAPHVCIPGVRPHLKGLVANGMHTSPEAVSKERDEGFLRVDDRDSAPGSVGDKKGVGNFNHGRFACGEVVSGHTVTCTTGPNRTTVSAPEIDTSVAVSGALFVIGCLAILHGRKRRLAYSPPQR